MTDEQPKRQLSEAELQQRVNAGLNSNKRHGAYALRDRGPLALSEMEHTHYLELQEKVSDRSGTIELIKECAIRYVMMVELAMNYVADKTAKNIDLEDVKVFNKLPAFQNSALRALKVLAELQPDDKYVIDEVKILEELKKKAQDENEQHID